MRSGAIVWGPWPHVFLTSRCTWIPRESDIAWRVRRLATWFLILLACPEQLRACWRVKLHCAVEWEAQGTIDKCITWNAVDEQGLSIETVTKTEFFYVIVQHRVIRWPHRHPCTCMRSTCWGASSHFASGFVGLMQVSYFFHVFQDLSLVNESWSLKSFFGLHVQMAAGLEIIPLATIPRGGSDMMRWVNTALFASIVF
jgi:hypothetical protein